MSYQNNVKKIFSRQMAISFSFYSWLVLIIMLFLQIERHNGINALSIVGFVVIVLTNIELMYQIIKGITKAKTKREKIFCCIPPITFIEPFLKAKTESIDSFN